MTLAGPDASKFHFVKQQQLAADLSMTAWTDGHRTIRVSTRKGAKVWVSDGRGTVDVRVTQGGYDTTKSARTLAAEHERRSLNAVEQAIALGMEPTAARNAFTAMTVAGDEGPIIDDWCVYIDAEDGDIKSTGCNVRHLDQEEAPQYIVDEMQQSAVSSDDDIFFPYGVNRVESTLIYKGGDRIVKWQPDADKPVSECGSVSIGLQGEGGLQYSMEQPICPDTFGPSSIPGENDQRYGSAWDGPQSDVGHFVATEGMALVNWTNTEPTTLENKVRYTW